MFKELKEIIAKEEHKNDVSANRLIKETEIINKKDQKGILQLKS